MTRQLAKTLTALLVIAAVIGATVWYLSDASRFKGQLEALLSRSVGLPVRIDGEVSWHFWPQVRLNAGDLAIDYQGQTATIGDMSVELDTTDLFGDPEHWVMQSVMLENGRVPLGERVLTIRWIRLMNLAADRPMPIAADVGFQPGADAEVFPLWLRGTLTVAAATPRFELTAARVVSPAAAGECEARGQAVTGLPAPAPSAQGDLLPVAILADFSGRAHCNFYRADLFGRTFHQVDITVGNDTGALTARVEAQRFLGGQGTLDVAVDTRPTAPQWTVTGELREVDSEALMAWLEQELSLTGPLSADSRFTLLGNDRAALQSSLAGQTRFRGGPGRIDITRLRASLIELAAPWGQADGVRAWPEHWPYQRLTGTWQAEGEQQRLDADLDNLTATGAGRYQPVKDQLAMDVELLFHETSESRGGFVLDPLLYDLPVPLQCRGTLRKTECRLDEAGARQVAAGALRTDSPTRRKLEQRIDEAVPEPYRDAARALLDALGGGGDEAPEP